MQENSLKHKILSSILWQELERAGTLGINFVISIILARLLNPEDFGLFVILSIFTGICIVFVDSGFCAALIQKKDITEADCSSVFYINIIMALVMYGLLFATTPWIAVFYRAPSLSLYLRILALVVIIRSFGNVQNALLNKRMMFKMSFRINWAGLLISGPCGIILAFRGFGVWSLIVQQLVNAAVVVVSLWFCVKWSPHWLFDRIRILQLFMFGWKLFLAKLLDTLYNDAYSLVIGKITNLTMLSYYNRGRTMASYVGLGLIHSTLETVLFPAFSKIQSDKEKTKLLARRGLQNIMFVAIPALALLFVLADPLVRILLTEKWLPCVIFLRFGCIEFLLLPLHAVNLQMVNASGRSDVFLVLEIIKKTQFAISLVLLYRYGIVTIVAASTVLSLICAIESGWMNRKLIDCTIWSQIWDLLPLILIGVISGGLVLFCLQFFPGPWTQLLVGGSIFCLLYLTGCWFFGKIPQEILNFFKKRSFAS